MIKSQLVDLVEASRWGWDHPFDGRLNLDRPFFLVELLKASVKCNSRGKQKLTRENSRRPKSGGLGPNVGPMLR
jgi:hypothetical protein